MSTKHLSRPLVGGQRHRKQSRQTECDVFNARVPVGTLVRYWRGVREGFEPSGVGKTRSTAQLLGGYEPCVWIEGCSGGIALTHVEVVDAPK